MKDIDLDPSLVEPIYPFQRHLGYHLTGWSKDYARFEIPIEEFLGNRYGIVHGGVHALMCDTAMGYSGCWTGDPADKRLGMTLSMNVNFLGQAKGGTLIAEGFRTGGGRKTFFAEARLRDELGTDIASATGVFRYRSNG